MPKLPRCPRCISPRRRTTHDRHGKPKFTCLRCGKYYSERSHSDLRYSKLPEEKVEAIFALLEEDPLTSAQEIESTLGVTWGTARKFRDIWLTRKGLPIPKKYAKASYVRKIEPMKEFFMENPDVKTNVVARKFSVAWQTAKNVRDALLPTHSHPSPPDAPEPASRKRKQPPSP